MTNDLPPFSGADTTCPKCGSSKLRMQWSPSNEACSVLDSCHSEIEGSYVAGEHLHVECKRCGYFWMTAPLDDEPDDAYLAAKLAGCEVPRPFTPAENLAGVAQIIYELIEGACELSTRDGEVALLKQMIDEFQASNTEPVEPSIPVSRIVAVLAERIDRLRANDAWNLADELRSMAILELSIDPLVLNAELARRKGAA